MRYAKVLLDGEYVAPKHAKLGYGSMVFVRYELRPLLEFLR
jgi:hypothetical protein